MGKRFGEKGYIRTDTHFTPGGWASLWEFPLTDKGLSDMNAHIARLQKTGSVTIAFVNNAHAFEYIPHRKVMM